MNTEFFDSGKISDYQDKLSSELDELDRNVPIWGTWDSYRLAVRGFDSYFSMISDLLYQNRWNNDEKYLDKAISQFKEIKLLSDTNDNYLSVNDLCLAGYSSVDLYEFGGKENEYLVYAQEIFNKINNLEDKKKFQTSMCGLFAKRFYKEKEDKAILVWLESNNKLLTNNLLDGGSSFANKNDDFGFFKTMDGGFSIPYKNVVENGLIVDFIKD